MGNKKIKIRNIIGIILIILIGVVVWFMGSTQLKWKYSNLGLAEYKEGNYQKSIEDYTMAIERNPDIEFFYNNRGLAYAELKEYEKALSDFDKAIELKPDYETAYFNRGLVYSRKGSWGNVEPYERAISDFSKAIKLDPDYVDAYYNRGLAYNQFVHYYNKPFSAEDEEKFNKAIADFDMVIELNPSYALALAGKANVVYRYGNWTEADKIYNEALRHEEEIIDKAGTKGLAGVYYSRGRNYFNFIDIRKALSDFKRVIELEPDNSAAFTYVSMINVELEQYEEAIRHADKNIEIEGVEKDSYYYLTLGKCYYGLGKYDKAITNLKSALALPMRYGSQEEIMRWLGKAYKENGEVEKAEEELQKAVESLSKKVQKGRRIHTIYQERGLCYLELEQYNKAISDFENVISLKEKSDRRIYFRNRYLDAYKNIGITYSKMGNKEKAKEYFQITLKLAEERGNCRVIEKTQKFVAEL